MKSVKPSYLDENRTERNRASRTRLPQAVTRGLRTLALSGTACVLVAASCSRDDEVRLTDSSTGLVALDTTLGAVAFRDVNYRLTSDDFAKYQVAQERIDALPEPPVVQRIDLRAPREDDVVVVVNQLERHEPARLAIVSSGLSVRDFVLTSLALGQALAFGTDQRVLLQPANRLFLEDNRLVIERMEHRRKFRIGDRGDVRIRIREDVDNDDDDEDHDNGRRVQRRGNDNPHPGLGKGRGNGNGRGNGKGKGGKG